MHICFDAQFPDEWVICTCSLGTDHSDVDCDGTGHE
jgi:hypothetical protein